MWPIKSLFSLAVCLETCLASSRGVAQGNLSCGFTADDHMTTKTPLRLMRQTVAKLAAVDVTSVNVQKRLCNGTRMPLGKQSVA